MGSWGYEAFRVEAARARIDVDTDERTIPHEVGWVHVAAHVAKGCYRGQETVSKVHNVGRPPRRMLLLHLDGSPEVLPETGDPVLLGERTVGRVGSVVRHHELGPIALALVKYSVPLDAELLAGAEDRVVQAAIDPDAVPEATPGSAARPHGGCAADYASGACHRHADHGRAHRRGAREVRRPEPPRHARGAGAHREGLRARRRGDDPRPHPGRGRQADARPAAAEGHGGRAAVRRRRWSCSCPPAAR